MGRRGEGEKGRRGEGEMGRQKREKGRYVPTFCFSHKSRTVAFVFAASPISIHELVARKEEQEGQK